MRLDTIIVLERFLYGDMDMPDGSVKLGVWVEPGEYPIAFSENGYPEIYLENDWWDLCEMSDIKYRLKSQKSIDIKSEVYNALSDIMFKTGASQKDMDDAIEWFNVRFYDDEYDDEN